MTITATLTKEQLSKLPKWAQDYISILEMRLQESEARAQTLFSATPTNTAWNVGLHENRHLPDGAMIQFSLPYKGWPDPVRVSVRIEKGTLDINANEAIALLPGAANHIVVVPRRE